MERRRAAQHRSRHAGERLVREFFSRAKGKATLQIRLAVQLRRLNVAHALRVRRGHDNAVGRDLLVLLHHHKVAHDNIGAGQRERQSVGANGGHGPPVDGAIGCVALVVLNGLLNHAGQQDERKRQCCRPSRQRTDGRNEPENARQTTSAIDANDARTVHTHVMIVMTRK